MTCLAFKDLVHLSSPEGCDMSSEFGQGTDSVCRSQCVSRTMCVINEIGLHVLQGPRLCTAVPCVTGGGVHRSWMMFGLVRVAGVTVFS